MTLSTLKIDYLCKHPISKQSYILGYWKWELYYIYFGVTKIQPITIPLIFILLIQSQKSLLYYNHVPFSDPSHSLSSQQQISWMTLACWMNLGREWILDLHCVMKWDDYIRLTKNSKNRNFWVIYTKSVPWLTWEDVPSGNINYTKLIQISHSVYFLKIVFMAESITDVPHIFPI